MASALPAAFGCTTCDDTVTTLVPGPAGADGADGADGAAGQNAYTALTAQMTMPAIDGGTVTATVASSAWMAYGQIIAVGDPGAGTPYAYMRVTAKPSATQVTLQNLETTAGAYASNVAPTTVFPVGTVLSPGGLQGPTGAAGASGAPTDATYWVSSPDGDLSAEVDMSALTAGFLKVAGGVPSTVAAVPMADIDTGASATSQVLKPDGAGSVVAGQVEDDEIDYTEVAIAATDIDWSLGRMFYKTLAANTAFTFSNTTAGKTIMVTLRQGAGTSYTATWPVGTYFPQGATPTMTTTSNAYAVYSFTSRGGTIIGTVVNDCRPTT